MKTPPKFRHLLACSTLLASASTGFAQTNTYQWSGATSSDFATSGNWATGGSLTAGPPPTTGGELTPISTTARINVGATGNTTPANALVYSSAQGHTIFNPANRALVIGNGSGTNGTVTITGGTFDSRGTGNDAIANGGGSGTLNINGGHYTNVNGTTIFALVIGDKSTGTLNIDSGSFTTGTLTFGENSSTKGGTAIVNLNGGVMEVGEFVENTSSAPTSTINFNGGTLRARKNSTVFMGSSSPGNVVDNARVLDGGAVIDTNGFAITIAKPLLQHSESVGGLTKSGTGTLTLTAANTYVGATAVDGGTLNITGSTASDSAVTVGGSAASSSPKLAGSGTVKGAVTLKSAGGGAAGILNAGDATAVNKVGTLTMGSSLEFKSGSIFEWDLGASSTSNPGTNYDSVAVTGNIDVASGSILKVVFSSTVLNDITTGDVFWSTAGPQTWNMSSIFGEAFNSGAFTSVQTSTNVSAYGSFSINSSSLTWTAIPEPTSALAGLLLTAGLVQRRRA